MQGLINQGFACNIKFPNLKQVKGDVNINNCACHLYLNSLEEIGGSFNVSSSYECDNEVSLKNIKSISGDLNVQKGTLCSSPQIFSAVEGTMNSIPPKNLNTYLKEGDDKNAKCYEFTTQEGVIKKKPTA